MGTNKKTHYMIKHVPMALVILRVLLAMFLVYDALDGRASRWFVIVFIIAAVSDALDGMIARRFDAITDLGSRMDALADVILYGVILYCVWRLHPNVIKAFLIPLLTVGSTQITSWVFSLAKFRKLTSYHSYVAKFWAFTIVVAVISLFGFNYAGFFFWLTIICGIISNFEDMLITALLPSWTCNVLTVGQALKIRESHLK